jgi:hypothetical protein
MNVILHMGFRRSFMLYVLATLIASVGALRASTNNLQIRLQEIDRMRTGRNGEMSKLEREALQLLGISSSVDKAARVYFSIAQMYFNAGLRQPDKLIEYSRKALDINEDLIRTCKLHLFWGDALKKKLVHVKGEERVQLRREALCQYLKVFDVVLQRKETNKIQALPAVNLYDYDGSTNDPGYQALARKQKLELETYRRVKFQNKLVRCEKKILSRVSSLYSLSELKLLKDDVRQIQPATEVGDTLLKKMRAKLQE